MFCLSFVLIPNNKITNTQLIKYQIEPEISLINSFVVGVNSGRPELMNIKSTACAKCHVRSRWLPSYHSAMLIVGGFSLQTAIKLPSILIIFSGFWAIMTLAKEVTQSEISSYLSLFLFMNCSGFGWIRWFFASTRHIQGEDFVKSWGKNIETNWMHPIFEYLMSYRYNQFAFTICACTILLLVNEPVKKEGLLVGGLIAVLPAIDHSAFFALLLFFVIFMICTIIQHDASKYNLLLTKTLKYIALGFAAIILIPLLNLKGNEGNIKLLKVQKYWNDFITRGYFFPFIEWWGLNIGTFFVSSLFVWIGLEKRHKKLFISTLVVFIFGNFVVFHDYPLLGVNYFMPVWALVTSILIVFAFQRALKAINDDETKGIVAAIFIALYVSMTMSSIYGLKRNIFISSEMWTEADEIVAKYLVQNTKKDSVFLTPLYDCNPATTLAGRVSLRLSDFKLYVLDYNWSMYSNEENDLIMNPESSILPFVQYSLENDHVYQKKHIRINQESSTWKVCYGFEAYQLYNRTRN